MESHSSFASQPHLLNSVLHGNMFHESISDPLMFLDFDRGFDELMLSDGAFVDNERGLLDMDTLEGSLGQKVLSDGNPPLSVSLEDVFEEKLGEDISSGTTTKPLRTRRDRSKTLVSERKRRGRMKEKLYELRSLVPNITKMDKASIIADAVTYVHSLQKQANNLEEEIAALESSSKECVFQVPVQNRSLVETVNDFKDRNGAQILRVATHELGDRRVYMEVECSKGDGVASSLYNAIESLEFFHIESSSFIISEKSVLLLTLKVRQVEEEMNAQTMKLWVMCSLLKEGFEFDMEAIL